MSKRGGDKKEKEDKGGAEDKAVPVGPEGGKGEGGKGEEEGEKGKGKKKFVVSEKRSEPKMSCAQKSLLFGIILVGGYFVASGSLTNQKDIKQHLGEHGFVKEENTSSAQPKEHNGRPPP